MIQHFRHRFGFGVWIVNMSAYADTDDFAAAERHS